MALRRDQVVRAARELLDEVGLDAFTTRALTDRLGVQRGALYWHVKSKRELLMAVANLVVTPVFEDAEEDAEEKGGDEKGGDWAEAVVRFAHRLRAAMLAQRDGARLVAMYTPLGPEGLRRLESRLADWQALGIPPAVGIRFADTITSYVTGYVLQEQADPPELTDFEADEDLPVLRELLSEGQPDSAETFAASVATIVLGMRAELTTLTG